MIIKISPDKERARSILEMAKNRENFVSSTDSSKFPTIVAESYYEIIKELATALLLLDGFKAIGENAHKETIDSLSKYKEIEPWKIELMNDLRIKRNKSSYEGKQIETGYLENKKEKFILIIDTLKRVIERKVS